MTEKIKNILLNIRMNVQYTCIGQSIGNHPRQWIFNIKINLTNVKANSYGCVSHKREHISIYTLLSYMIWKHRITNSFQYLDLHIFWRIISDVEEYRNNKDFHCSISCSLKLLRISIKSYKSVLESLFPNVINWFFQAFSNQWSGSQYTLH